MKRFRFGLERVLGLRVGLERAARSALAQALTRQEQAEARRVRVDADLMACRGDRAEAIEGLARAVELGLVAVRSRVEAELGAARASVAQARDRFRRRRTDVEVLRKLRRKEFDAWRREAEAREQSELEELGRMREQGAKVRR
ncbi:MAG: hypothetical protein H6836_00655 [Planctomycetes bacterium]|nr:hypothetical protein [Planctomycetota bacterium]MCB9888052.1 hypothetical protein [Planctomycetota bacterium]